MSRTMIKPDSSVRFASAENGGRSVWAGAAFVVEALVLLAFLAGSIAILLSIFAYAEEQGQENHRITQAIVLASNTAEEFNATPEFPPQINQTDELIAICTVETKTNGIGTYYEATIVVTDKESGDEVYTLTSTRYVSGGGQIG